MFRGRNEAKIVAATVSWTRDALDVETACEMYHCDHPHLPQQSYRQRYPPYLPRALGACDAVRRDGCSHEDQRVGYVAMNASGTLDRRTHPLDTLVATTEHAQVSDGEGPRDEY